MNTFCTAKVTRIFPKCAFLVSLLSNKDIYLDVQKCNFLPPQKEGEAIKLKGNVELGEELLLEIEKGPENSSCEWKALQAWKLDIQTQVNEEVPEIKALEFVVARIAKVKMISIQNLTGHLFQAPESVKVNICKNFLLEFPSIFRITQGIVTLVGHSVIENPVIGNPSGNNLQKAVDDSISYPELKSSPKVDPEPKKCTGIHQLQTSAGKPNEDTVIQNESSLFSQHFASLNRVTVKDNPPSEDSSSCHDNMKYNVQGIVSGTVLHSRAVLNTPLGKVHFKRKVCDFIKNASVSLQDVVYCGDVLFCNCELQPDGSPEKWIAQRVWKPKTASNTQSATRVQNAPEGIKRKPEDNFQSDSNLLNGSGKILHIDDNFGFIYSSEKKSIFFNSKVCGTFVPDKCTTLKTYLKVGEKVFFKAKAQNKTGRRKWKAEEVFKTNPCTKEDDKLITNQVIALKKPSSSSEIVERRESKRTSNYYSWADCVRKAPGTKEDDKLITNQVTTLKKPSSSSEIEERKESKRTSYCYSWADCVRKSSSQNAAIKSDMETNLQNKITPESESSYAEEDLNSDPHDPADDPQNEYSSGIEKSSDHRCTYPNLESSCSSSSEGDCEYDSTESEDEFMEPKFSPQKTVPENTDTMKPFFVHNKCEEHITIQNSEDTSSSERMINPEEETSRCSVIENRVLGSPSGNNLQNKIDDSISYQEFKSFLKVNSDPKVEINQLQTSGKTNQGIVLQNEPTPISTLDIAKLKDYPPLGNLSSCDDNVKYNVRGTVSGTVLHSRAVLSTPFGKVHFKRKACDFIKNARVSLISVVKNGDILFCDCELQPDGSPEKWIAQRVWKPKTASNTQSATTVQNVPTGKKIKPESKVQSGTDSNLLNGSGKILHIDDNFGFIYTSEKERVFFNSNVCRTFVPDKCTTLKSYLKVGEKVFFKAKAQNKTGCLKVKWKAEEVFKTNPFTKEDDKLITNQVTTLKKPSSSSEIEERSSSEGDCEYDSTESEDDFMEPKFSPQKTVPENTDTMKPVFVHNKYDGLECEDITIQNSEDTSSSECMINLEEEASKHTIDWVLKKSSYIKGSATDKKTVKFLFRQVQDQGPLSITKQESYIKCATDKVQRKINDPSKLKMFLSNFTDIFEIVGDSMHLVDASKETGDIFCGISREKQGSLRYDSKTTLPLATENENIWENLSSYMALLSSEDTEPNNLLDESVHSEKLKLKSYQRKETIDSKTTLWSTTTTATSQRLNSNRDEEPEMENETGRENFIETEQSDSSPMEHIDWLGTTVLWNQGEKLAKTDSTTRDPIVNCLNISFLISKETFETIECLVFLVHKAGELPLNNLHANLPRHIKEQHLQNLEKTRDFLGSFKSIFKVRENPTNANDSLQVFSPTSKIEMEILKLLISQMGGSRSVDLREMYGMFEKARGKIKKRIPSETDLELFVTKFSDIFHWENESVGESRDSADEFSVKEDIREDPSSNVEDTQMVHYEQVVEISPHISLDEFEIIRYMMGLLFNSLNQCMNISLVTDMAVKRKNKTVKVFFHQVQEIQELLEKFTSLFSVDKRNGNIYPLITNWEYEALIFLFPIVYEAQSVTLRDLDKRLEGAPTVVLLEICSDEDVKAFLVKFCDIFTMHEKPGAIEDSTKISRLVFLSSSKSAVVTSELTPKIIQFSETKTADVVDNIVASCEPELSPGSGKKPHFIQHISVGVMTEPCLVLGNLDLCGMEPDDNLHTDVPDIQPQDSSTVQKNKATLTEPCFVIPNDYLRSQGLKMKQENYQLSNNCVKGHEFTFSEENKISRVSSLSTESECQTDSTGTIIFTKFYIPEA